MVDLPAGFRVVSPGQPAVPSSAPALPAGFRVVKKPEAYQDSYVAQGMSGFNEGLGNILGAPVDLATSAINLGGAGINAAFGTKIPAIEKPFLGSESINGMMGGVGAIKPETADPGKQAVRRIAQDVGSAAVPVLGTAGRAARPVSMAAKELALSVGSGTGAAVAQQVAPDNMWAELAGQILGGGAVAGVTGAVKKAITPFPASPERLAAADVMAREGVDLTAGQRTGNNGLQYAESELGGARIGDINERQAEQFTQAALQRVGVAANRATPEVIDGAFTRIGQDFDGLAARNNLQADQQMAADLRATWGDYTSVTNPNARVPIVENTIRDIAEAIRNNGGVLNGPVYSSLRSRMDKAARAARNDPALMDALFGIRNSLDAAMERGLSPEEVALWRQARTEYKNLLVIERAATSAGEGAALGLISPAQLRSAAATQNRRAYARGNGDFADLARSGAATMTPLPQSGTAPRATVQAIKAALPFVGAAVGGGGTLGLGALAGAAAGAAAPKVAGAMMLSRPGRAYLSNQLIRGRSGSNGVGPIAAALAGQTSNQAQVSPLNQRISEVLLEGRKRPLEISVPY